MQCTSCGKEIGTTGASFCPFCGRAIGLEKPVSGPVQEWVGRIQSASSIPEREKLVEKARKECGEVYEIEFEALFIGHRKKTPKRMMDFSPIKSYILQIYLDAKPLGTELADIMRREIFHDPQLERCQQMSGDAEKCLKQYLVRMCTEFIEYFLQGDSRYNKTIFGFRLDSRKEKTTAEPAATMLRNMAADDQLTDEEKDMLKTAFYQAFTQWSGGRTEWLDQALKQN